MEPTERLTFSRVFPKGCHEYPFQNVPLLEFHHMMIGGCGSMRHSKIFVATILYAYVCTCIYI